MSLTYTRYLKLDALLNQQEVKSSPEEHDELLFIIIHQSYELWFKLILHEIEKIKADFSNNDLFGAIHTFKRVRTVLKTLVSQIDILETMTPMSFTSFRDRLDTASGFQSIQFRELEFVLGYKRPAMMEYADRDSPDYARLNDVLNARSVMDHFYDFLEHRGTAIPGELREKDVAAPTMPSPQLQDGLLELYKEGNEMGILFELMTDCDEGMQEWRYRHVKLVERTIGNKKGTGGSLGVEFLKKSLFTPVFPDLWAIRHRL
ncbi:MAG: tryptophan 2,3-dioxygenase [Planctomycetota bacterium]|jgi:tryptophan 2,3-dioxygenase